MSTALVSNFYDFGDSVYKQNMSSTHNLQFSESSYHQPLPLSRRNSNPVSSNINVNLNTQVNNTPTTTAKLTCLENVNNLATQLSSHRKLDRSYSEPVDKKNAPNNNQQPNPNSSRYKTELCRPFEENGHCKYGEKCQFAHGYQELRTLSRHPKYKTELCRTFHTIGFCPYGPRCHFIHNADEARKPPPSSPTNPTIIPRELQQRPSTIPIMTPSLGSTAESPSPHSSMSGSPNSMSFLEEVYNKPFSPSPITPTTSSAFSFPEFSAPHSPPLVSLKSSVPYSQSYNSVQALNHRNELESLLREASPLLGALEAPPSPVDSLASDLDTLSISGASEIHSNTPAGPISSGTHGLRLPIFNIISGQ